MKGNIMLVNKSHETMEHQTRFTIYSLAPTLLATETLDLIRKESSYHLLAFNRASDLLSAAAKSAPDAVLIQQTPPGITCLDMIIQLRAGDPDTQLIVVSNSDSLSTNPELEQFWRGGANDVIYQPVHPQELLFRIKRAITIRRISRIYEQLEAENRHYVTAAVTDRLTGLGNQRLLADRLNEEYMRTVRFGGVLGVMIADIDGLTAINDRYGHHAGDVVIRKVGELLKQGIRKIDTVCRIGGGEFTLLLPETGNSGLTITGERLRTIVAEARITAMIEGAEVVLENVRISLGGVNSSDKRAISPTDLIDLALQALNKAKSDGRNRAVIA